jgi:uncharacterized protein
VTLAINPREGGVRFAVQVKPRSSRSRIEGIREGALVVALTAPPVEGAANAELAKLLARALGVSRSAVTIAAGASGRRKLVDVADLEVAEAERLLRAACPSDA